MPLILITAILGEACEIHARSRHRVKDKFILPVEKPPRNFLAVNTFRVKTFKVG